MYSPVMLDNPFPSRAPSNVPAQNTSLYVGDLAPDVTEALLLNLFKTVGTVLSVRVCRNPKTNASLCYGYVNFQYNTDAEKALNTLNHHELHDRPIRLMWRQSDPHHRKQSKGNLIVKNLHSTVDNAKLSEVFSSFGKILSCKVMYTDPDFLSKGSNAEATDSNTEGTSSPSSEGMSPSKGLVSKGYGFVHFETEEDAKKALEKINDTEIEGQKVTVEFFQSRSENRIEVKGALKEGITEQDVATYFSQFGTVVSSKILVDRQVILVTFDSEEAVEKSIEGSNNKHVETISAPAPPAPTPDPPQPPPAPETTPSAEEGETKPKEEETPSTEAAPVVEPKKVPIPTLCVRRAVSKQDRRDGSSPFGRGARGGNDHQKYFQQTMEESVGTLYVGNLTEMVSDTELKEAFSPFGELIRVQVMTSKQEPNKSRGFGFVRFKNAEDAEKAMAAMKDVELGGAKISVNKAYPKGGGGSSNSYSNSGIGGARGFGGGRSGGAYDPPHRPTSAYYYGVGGMGGSSVGQYGGAAGYGSQRPQYPYYPPGSSPYSSAGFYGPVPRGYGQGGTAAAAGQSMAGYQQSAWGAAAAAAALGGYGGSAYPGYPSTAAAAAAAYPYAYSSHAMYDAGASSTSAGPSAAGYYR